MSEIKRDNTEEKIVEAARAVFIKKGMDGARMQEIADEAGINKALLHYYFRSKQKLYEAIFQHAFKQVFPDIKLLISSEQPIGEKIKIFIEKYNEILLKNPYLPSFLLKEINRDPEFLASVIKSQGIHPVELFNMFEKEMKAGNIRETDSRDLMINLLALSVFPFAARPLLQIMFFGDNSQAYNAFLEKRKESVKSFIQRSILLK